LRRQELSEHILLKKRSQKDKAVVENHLGMGLKRII
jgi:hypothetical protein